MELLIAGLIILVLSLVGTPLFALLAAGGLLAFYLAGIDTAVFIVELHRLADFPALIAIPLFTFAGYILAESKAPRRLMNFVQALFGWMPGGMAIVALCTTAMFTAFTGASGVTIIALGGLLYPALLEHGYPQKFSLGLVTTSGSLGLLFPPSLPIILYALVAKVSLDTLFLAGLVPGVFLLLVLFAYGIRTGRKAKITLIPFSAGVLWRALKDAAWELPLSFVVIGGIYGGYFTATEASAITAMYVLIVEVIIRRDLNITGDIPRITRSSMILVGAILVMMGAALGVTNYLIDQEIPKILFEFISRFVTSKNVFLIVLNLFILVMNMIEIFSAIIIIVPIIVPVALQYGVNPVHLGIIFLLNLELGYMTPPLGLNLFLSSIRFEKHLPVVYKAVLPFFLLVLIVLLLITYIPHLSLLLTGLPGK